MRRPRGEMHGEGVTEGEREEGGAERKIEKPLIVLVPRTLPPFPHASRSMYTCNCNRNSRDARGPR